MKFQCIRCLKMCAIVLTRCDYRSKMRNMLVWLAVALLVTSAVAADSSLSCEPDTVPLVTRRNKQPHRTSCPFADIIAGTHSWQAMIENSQLDHPQVSHDAMEFDERLVQTGTPEYGLYLTNRASPSARKKWIDSRADTDRSRSLAKGILDYFNESLFDTPSLKRFMISQDVAGNMLSSMNIPAEQQSCPKPPKCTKSSRFRTIDGSCNNFEFTDWGQTNTALRRLLSARYSDGVSEPPVSVVDGRPLPNARVLSTTFSPDKDVPDKVNTIMVMQIGQMVSHDTALSPDQQSQKANISINCCGADEKEPLGPSDTCYSIEIPGNDSFYSNFDRRCMSLVRSMTTVSKNCHLGPAEQFSAVTHFVDASNIYGSENDVADSIRLKKGGKLRTQVAKKGGNFPPNSDKPTEDCDIRSSEDPICYTGGDVRINQHPDMSLLQTLFLREHNRVADTLAVLNSHWDDERLYLEARRIVIGVWQHIVYVEWLPLVLGQEYVKKRNLTVLEGYSSGYDINLDPSTLNSFTTGCFRTFHSMVEGNIRFFDENGGSRFAFPLREWFDRPSILQDGNFDRLARGLAEQPAQTMDPFISEDLTNFLFKHQSPFGLDLAAIDIQRSRDHGLRSYNDFRELCGLPKAKNFTDFSDVIDKKYAEQLPQFYSHVDDVDLMVGIKLENLLPDSLVGKTCECIIGEQFFRWKFGDLWFYDFKENPAAFTPGQLKEIKKSTLSKVICNNGDTIKKLPRNSFLRTSNQNPLIQCDSISSINLKLWQEPLPVH